MSALPAIPLVAQRKDRSRNSREKAQKAQKRRCRDCTRRRRASCWEGRFVTLAGQYLKGGSLSAKKAPVSPINFPFVFFCVFCAFLRLFLPMSALPAIPLVLGVVRGVGIVPPFYEPVKLWFGRLQ